MESPGLKPSLDLRVTLIRRLIQRLTQRATQRATPSPNRRKKKNQSRILRPPAKSSKRSPLPAKNLSVGPGSPRLGGRAHTRRGGENILRANSSINPIIPYGVTNRAGGGTCPYATFTGFAPAPGLVLRFRNIVFRPSRQRSSTPTSTQSIFGEK
jgi:hypothetical protein